MSERELTGREVAVVGMAGRFPKARDLAELWRNLRDGVESVTFWSAEELAAAGVPREALADPSYVRAGSLLEGVDLFDAEFFGYTPREAEILDPQQRLFLEQAWTALEDAGYEPASYGGLIGIYAGAAWNTYLLTQLVSHPELFAGGHGFQVFISNDKDFLPTRVSYKLNLKGPSLIVQTSCSTSLVAIHLACLSLLNYECDLALAGGVTVKVPQVEGYFYQDGGLASPDGHCRTFDERAAGTIFGSGVGVVALKRLAEALADGDAIRAVIKGSAINNDGALKVSYTAPSAPGQAEVIAAAQAMAGVTADTIGYVEAHGTGTALGDPIEVAALTKVFREATDERGFCALGSIKSNLGHLDAAAGVAGFLKTVLALQHGTIPPSLHFERPNPKLDLASSPFWVPTRASEWPHRDGVRRAGVSSFGVGGTNAHLVVEEAPPALPPSPRARPWQLLTLSARSATALDAASARLGEVLDADGENGAPDLADTAYTLQVGRTVFRHRRVLVCRDREEAVAALRGGGPGLFELVDDEDPRDRPVAFLFPGRSPGREARHPEALYAGEPGFRERFDRCAEILLPKLGRDLRGPFHDSAGEADGAVAPPVLFAIEWSLAGLWMDWGVRPQALLGQGVGELVAASLAGVLTLEEALGLVAGEAVGLRPAPPLTPLVSSLTGDWITPAQAADPGYWQFVADVDSASPGRRASRDDGAHLSSSERFAAGVELLRAEPDRVLLEVEPATGAAALAEAVGRLWLAGVQIDWAAYHRGEGRRRVPLPTYPFERQRFWIDGTARAASPVAAESAEPRKRSDPDEWLYVPTWRRAVPLRPVAAGTLAGRRVRVLPCGPGNALAERLTTRLRAAGAALPPEAMNGGGAPEEVFFLAGEDSLESGFAGLLDLLATARELSAGPPCRLWVVARGAFLVTGGERVDPSHAALLAPCRVIPHEMPHLDCRFVDLDELDEPAAAAHLLAELDEPAAAALLLAELAAAEPAPEVVAYRHGQRWVQELAPAGWDGGPPLAALRPDGAYLVTGGLDGVGWSLAQCLAAPGRRLLLLEGAAGREDRVQTLEALGARVHCRQVDFADRAAVERAVNEGIAELGALHGAIHAAGAAGERAFRTIVETGADEVAWHFVPKVQGLAALDRALAGRELDFRLLASSLATVLGGLGSCALAAADLSLEAFASASDGGWRSIAWDAWQEDGGLAAVRADLAELALAPEEGAEVLRRVLAAATAPNVVVSTADPAARLARALRHGRPDGAQSATLHPRPPLPTPYAPPEGELERRLAEVWQRVLGFEQVGVHDNFFELGGDSFLAVQVVSRLRGDLEMEIPVAKLYQGTTVRALARLLAEDPDEAVRRRAAQLAERREAMGQRQEFLRQRRERRG